MAPRNGLGGPTICWLKVYGWFTRALTLPISRRPSIAGGADIKKTNVPASARAYAGVALDQARARAGRLGTGQEVDD